ncbi:neuropeptide FF receptor 2-like [Dendronephthya gigantea]|uniref:neuropeptide FF receptor 2-like n=1 Tax=Dendronephthya gigantea TaxID=151771 RepID=UPI00106D75D6|nr:neuropeptide FF receptor 2-like [Dendronephthya gigantea]XP_028397593.1 neuropeptide FF receptor 2-like [Dendronephthya gigantea]XP_028397594.1 neuropeptide FF receptor 2-like [Dendronephthya gigantea]XP_028397595.1 neuropeptide FF receptor 2-like [Dendronephthya gigantea]XP_028397596.1 neuropeptide FF receptor 2-like [Dendronephthya gigantea]XP_028397597.1 neuropeptide FF receptor 2-like [Dendronephthya gigantea]
MTANASNGTEGEDLRLGDRKWFIIFKYSIYCIIFLISLIGNTMVCFVICRRMKVKTVTNYFIMNLAVSDLLYTLCIPFDVYATVNDAWPYGAIMCRVLYPAQTATITVSGFTLTALSVTRFWAVLKPLRRQLSVKQASSVIALLWVLATSTVIPYIIYLKLEGTCEEEWPHHEQRRIYTASLFVIQYAVPLFIITVCYISIALELTKGQAKTANRTLAKARGKEARKVIKMLVIVTLVFAFLTLPSSIMWMWLDFGNAVVDKFPNFWDVMDVLNVLDFLNCASNPIIYSFCNESFSREFRRQLGCVVSVPSTTSNNSFESGKVTTAFGSSSPGNGHATPLRESLSKDGNTEQNADRATLL